MTADSPGAPPPLKGAGLVFAAFSLALANFVVVLDITIANVSVPHISGSLGAAPSQGTWVITSYAVAEAISVPLTGWLAGRFGAVRTFLGSIIGFGFFSMMCGLSPNLEMLILFRIFQGLCGGPIMPMSQTLLLRIMPREKAAVGFALWSMTTVTAPICGPILGGVISDNLSWHWIFLINLPIVALAATLVYRNVRRHETPTKRLPIDFVGLGLLVLWIGALQIMLDKGREEDWFASPLITALGITSAVGFVAFLIWELTERHPIVDLRVLRHRGFAVATMTQSFAYAAFFAQIVLIPLWLQTSLGYTATWAGFTMAYTGVFAVLLSPVAATLARKVDPRFLISGGILWLSTMALWRSGWFAGLDYWHLVLPQLLQGAGMPFFFIATSALALGSVLPEETASAAGLINFVRTLSGAIAVSISTTLWEDGAKVERTVLVGAMNDTDMALAKLQAGGLSLDQARANVSGLVDLQAVTLATNHVFVLSAVMFVIAACIIWAAPRPMGQADLSQAH